MGKKPAGNGGVEVVGAEDYRGVPADQIERNKKALGDGGWVIPSYHCDETRFLVAANPARTETVHTLPTTKET